MMLEAKDPAIRLFGRTIQLNDDVSAAYAVAAAAVVVVDSEQTSSDHHFCSSNGSASPQSVFRKNSTDGEVSMDLKLEHGSSTSILENTNEDQAKSSTITDDTTQAPTEEDKDSEEGSSGSQEQPLKKPTKILPCPRCNSTDTKFCYFNNYNVNQPRHFCKNCQRYWTAGGTMRSMVIGAGRRKNKTTSCLSHHPFAIPNTFQPHQDDNGVNSDAQKSASISFQNFANLWPNPAFVPSPFPVPVYAMPPYWGCQAMAWMPPTSASATMRPNSPLGKHPRDENELESSNKEHHGEDKRAETKVLAPKTLRFDDPSEAAKSSIWTTLGIKNEKTRTLDTSAFFGGFQLKGGETNATRWSTSRFLQANPAALCRSLKFQECGE